MTRITGALHDDVVHLRHLPEFFLEREAFQTKVVEKIKTHILWSIKFFQKPRRSKDNTKKYDTGRQATGNIMVRRKDAICMPGD